MGIILIGMYLAFVFVSVGLFSLLSLIFTNKLIKSIVIFLGLLTAISPILFLYGRDYLIAKQVSKYCENNEGIVVVADIGDKMIEFSTETGENRELWRTLISHPGKSLIINVKKSNLVKKSGRYIFTAMSINSPECLDYDNYIEHQSIDMKAMLKREFSDFCIGISEYHSTENIIHLEYKTESFPISTNSFYSFNEEKASLTDKSNGQEFAYSKKVYVHREFTLFEFGTLFHFPTSCSGKNSNSKYLLLSKFYK